MPYLYTRNQVYFIHRNYKFPPPPVLVSLDWRQMISLTGIGSSQTFGQNRTIYSV